MVNLKNAKKLPTVIAYGTIWEYNLFLSHNFDIISWASLAAILELICQFIQVINWFILGELDLLS